MHCRNQSTRPFPSRSLLAGAVNAVLLLAPALVMAQTAPRDPGQVGNPESWRTDEFKLDWGLGAIGAEYAYARGLSGAGINAGIMDDGTAMWHGDLQGRVSGLTVKDAGCESRTHFAGPGACFRTDGGSTFTYTKPFTAEELAKLQADVKNGKMQQWELDQLTALQGYQYNIHGTHVAGIIGANRNGFGQHGVAFNAALHATGFITDAYQNMETARKLPGGEYYSLSTNKVERQAALKDAYAQMEARHVRVINNSWGWGNEPKNAAEMDAAAIAQAWQIEAYSAWAKKNDGIQVWAAGNFNGEIASFLATIPRYDKAAEPYWLSVANLGKDGKIYAGSSICGLSKDWCITAPGTEIASTVPVGAVEGELQYDAKGNLTGFEIKKEAKLSGISMRSGTSMAAPHVTGGLALLMERYPYLTSAQVRDVLLTTAQDLGAAGVDEIYGWGLMDLKKAIDGPGQMRVDTEVKMDQRAGGAKVWSGEAWDDWRNDIGGSGKLTKSGAGWLRLSGSNSFGGVSVKSGVLELSGSNTLKGAVNVAGGELLLNGKLVNTALDVQGGVATVHGDVQQGVTTVGAKGRLQGSGTLAQTTVAGTIAPGVAGIGTLHVDGTYTQLPGSVYEVDLGGSGKSDLLEIRGQAQLQGGEVKATGATLGDHYQILTAQGITGAFAKAGSSTSQPFLAFTLSQTPSVVKLDVQRGQSLASVATTSNQLSAAGAADALSDQHLLLKRLTQLSAPQAVAAFNRIGGETYASQRSVLVEQGRDLNESVASRLRTVQGDFLRQGADSGANGIWVDARGRGGHINSDGNAARTEYQSHGLTVGYDRSFGDGWSAGVVGATRKGGTQVRERAARNEHDGNSFGLYGGKEWGALGVRAGWMMSDNRVSADRQVAYGAFNERNLARYSSKSQQGFVEAGYSFNLGHALSIEPFAQWSRVAVKDPAFQETGGLSALSVEASRSQVDFATAGVRFATDLALVSQQHWLEVGGALAYRQASGDLDAATTAAWQGGTPFSSLGAPLDKRATLLNLNLGARLSRNTLLELSYDGEFAKEAHDHAINARFSLNF